MEQHTETSRHLCIYSLSSARQTCSDPDPQLLLRRRVTPEVGGQILCVHGGLGDGRWDLNDLRRVRRPLGPSDLDELRPSASERGFGEAAGRPGWV